MRSKSDDFIPVELAVPYYLQVLVATANGTEPPPAPDFDTRDVGTRSKDYIERFGLDSSDPDALVFGATTVAALGTSRGAGRRNAIPADRADDEAGTGQNRTPEEGRHRGGRPDPQASVPMTRRALYDRGRRIKKRSG